MKPPLEPSRQVLADLHDSAYRWAITCCRFDEDSAREVMQMVYVEILTGRAAYDARASVKTWLFAVVRNTSLRLAAGARRARALENRLAESMPANDVGHDVCGRDLWRRQTRAAIIEALGSLSPQQRQIVELVYYHELTVEEAARVLGIGLGSARQHFHRAKRTLAAALRPMKEALGDG